MRIAFLGLGIMGSHVAEHLMAAGHELTVWSRTRSHAEPLGKKGARVADSAAEAVRDAEVIFTMVFDDQALEEVLYSGNVLKSMTPGAIHVSLSTLSVALSDRLTLAHRAARLKFVAAPVFGRPEIAKEGRLFTAVAGEPDAVNQVRPLLESFSRSVTMISEKPSAAHALKIGGNFLITAMIASLSESLIYAEGLGIEPKVFLETVNSALFRSPFYEAYGKVMLNPPEKAGATIALGEKDMRLFREAAKETHLSTPLADIFESYLEQAIREGMKDEDWAEGYFHLARGVMMAAA